MTGGELSRRGFLAISGVAGAALLSGTSLADSDPSDFEAHGLLVGPGDNRPDAGGAYLDQWDTYHLVYLAADTGSFSEIETGDSQWNDVGSMNESGHSLSDDGTTVVSSFTDLNVAGGVDAVDDGDGTATISTAEWKQETGTFTMSAATSDTVTITFADTYRVADNNVGIDTTGGALSSVGVFWRDWVLDANGNITGMTVVYRNETTSSKTGRWTAIGEPV